MSKMSLRIFFVLALAVAVGLSVAVSPFASSPPDGLEKVAGEKGFLEDGTLHSLQEESPIPDYAFPGVDNPRIATGVAGFVGTLAVAAIAVALGWLFHRRRPPDGEGKRRPGHRYVSSLCNHQPGLIGLAGDPASPIHRLDPRAKMLGLFAVTVVAITTPFSLWPVWVACAAALAAIAATARIPGRTIWRRARVIVPLVLFVAVFIPFFRKGGQELSFGPLTISEEGLQTFLAVSAKATIGTVSAVVLGATTTFPDVLRALDALRVPRLFTLIAAFMYRYLFVIVDEVQRMRAALASRGYRPRWVWQIGAVGRVVSALFLRSYGRGERVYLAMLARGFGGVMPQLDSLTFRRIDAMFIALVACSLVAFRLALGAST